MVNLVENFFLLFYYQFLKIADGKGAALIVLVSVIHIHLMILLGVVGYFFGIFHVDHWYYQDGDSVRQDLINKFILIPITFIPTILFVYAYSKLRKAYIQRKFQDFGNMNKRLYKFMVIFYSIYCPLLPFIMAATFILLFK